MAKQSRLLYLLNKEAKCMLEQWEREDLERYRTLRREGYSFSQAGVMSGLIDPEEV
jgi:hypothetical protein